MGVLAAAQVGKKKEGQENRRKPVKKYCTFSPFRRAEPPTEKEVLQSLAMSQMKKINAAKVGFSLLSLQVLSSVNI